MDIKLTEESWFKRKYKSGKFLFRYYFDLFKPYGRLSLEFSKILLGCLLFIFVPQLCEGPDESLELITKQYMLNISNNNVKHVCTFQDNFYDVNNFKIFVIFWNFLTLGVFLSNFIIELIREKYIQTHFEYTITYPVSDIKKVVDRNEKNEIYDKIKNSYNKKTRYLYYSNYICLFMIITNIIFTSIMIYKYYYDGFRSITGLFSIVILIFQKLYYNYDVLQLSLDNNFIISTSLMKPHDYNTLDPIKFKYNQYIKKEHDNKSYNLYYIDKYDTYFLITHDEHISIFSNKDNKNNNIKKQLKNKIKKDKLNNSDLTLDKLIEQLQDNDDINTIENKNENENENENDNNKVKFSKNILCKIYNTDESVNEIQPASQQLVLYQEPQSRLSNSQESYKNERKQSNISRDDIKEKILYGNYNPAKIIDIINKHELTDQRTKLNNAINNLKTKKKDNISSSSLTKIPEISKESYV
jgi:hypothetical protein